MLRSTHRLTHRLVVSQRQPPPLILDAQHAGGERSRDPPAHSDDRPAPRREPQNGGFSRSASGSGSGSEDPVRTKVGCGSSRLNWGSRCGWRASWCAGLGLGHCHVVPEWIDRPPRGHECARIFMVTRDQAFMRHDECLKETVQAATTSDRPLHYDVASRARGLGRLVSIHLPRRRRPARGG